ncbi:hypothetical protein [Blastococcus tunisiensis]|uniref:Uncharacterized protein n=1 Tax=Blastococcus tunisiensis TaxID=1798228 RepID=A0A1I1YQM1_9ACTN|nr:hypothetical protein [Blastococcus sp. DSM 46838]SFE20250.1 hypothetical protein SAMN05216574_102394 [Blastococcus sp. DSM 46838]
MSPFRWDVLLVGFVLALPVLALGMRGDLSIDEMMTRILWCLGAGWVVVVVLRAATAPPPAAKRQRAAPHAAAEPEDEDAESSPAL